MTQALPPGLSFPNRFPIKAIGRRHPELEQRVLDIIRKHTGAKARPVVEIRPSKQQNYHSITVTILADSKAQLDQIYLDLNACELIVMTL